MTGPPGVACVRVVDMLPGVDYKEWQRTNCSECTAKIIVSLPGVIFVKEHPGAFYVCMQCAIRTGKRPTGEVPGALDLVEEAIGKEGADQAVKLMVRMGDLIEAAAAQGRTDDLVDAYDHVYGRRRGHGRTRRA